jgi:glutaredoxin
VFGAVYYLGYHRRAHRYDAFARCLSSKGIKMYGAYWCPHCADEKALFDQSFKYAPYVECGVQGTTAKLTDTCSEAGIKHFPTWQFPPVGERVEGLMPLEDLSLRSGCPLE